MTHSPIQRREASRHVGPFVIDQFAGFFDDAALFPPGNAPMTTAVPEHRARRAASTGTAVGPFITAASRLDELSAVLDTQPDPTQPIEVGLVVAGGADGVMPAMSRAGEDIRITVRAVEVAMRHDTAPGDELDALITVLDQALPPGGRGFIETGYAPDVLTELHRLHRTGHAIKFRCGGVTADLFPTTEQLAAGIATALQTGVAFKCTAGLHHAVRHTAPTTSFEHFGFLNVLLAAGAADPTDPTNTGALISLLDERDPDVVADRTRALGRIGLARARRRFQSYGTCDITEPLADLIDLQLLESPTAIDDHCAVPTERRVP